MPHYLAFLRGVSPQTLQMAMLTECLKGAGFREVQTVLSSGNVAFSCPNRQVAELEIRIEALLKEATGRAFHTIIRTRAELETLLSDAPFARHKLDAGRKRVVSFSRKPLSLPAGFAPQRGNARILAVKGREAFTTYQPGTEGPVFMELIADAFGKEVTTRTWDTLLKCMKTLGQNSSP